jgi:S-adenosyl methyltransferase
VARRWLGSGRPDDSGPAVRVDTTVAHIARVYDYWLGGKDNFAVDRIAAERVIAAYPDIVRSARGNRAFLGRAVRYLVREAGVRQFLDIGTGLPAADNTHEVAQDAALRRAGPGRTGAGAGTAVAARVGPRGGQPYGHVGGRRAQELTRRRTRPAGYWTQR